MNRKYWDRKDRIYKEEDAPSEEKLKFLYTTKRGRFLLKSIFARRWFSILTGIYYKSSLSKKKIIEKNRLEEFNSFNEYFIRKEKRESVAKQGELISPADSRLRIYNIDEKSKIPIKGATYSIEELIEDKELYPLFAKGICLVYRLTLSDYHRYVYIDNGILKKSKKIKGMLHTVRPIEGNEKNYFKNSRVISYMETNTFGKMVQIEVGAMLVGKISNHKETGSIEFMEEKGFFEYGGSTIIQIFKEETVAIDKDIVEMSLKGIEVKVVMGEKVGECLKG